MQALFYKLSFSKGNVNIHIQKHQGYRPKHSKLRKCQN